MENCRKWSGSSNQLHQPPYIQPNNCYSQIFLKLALGASRTMLNLFVIIRKLQQKHVFKKKAKCNFKNTSLIHDMRHNECHVTCLTCRVPSANLEKSYYSYLPQSFCTALSKLQCSFCSRVSYCSDLVSRITRLYRIILSYLVSRITRPTPMPEQMVVKLLSCPEHLIELAPGSQLTLEHKPYLNLHHHKPWLKITRYLNN